MANKKPKVSSPMKVRINSVQHSGDLAHESIWLHAVGEDDLKNYLVAITTYLPNGKVSAHARYIYWFSSRIVKKGDWIVLFTKEGRSSTQPNAKKTRTHFFYMGFGEAMYYTNGECVALLKKNALSHRAIT